VGVVSPQEDQVINTKALRRFGFVYLLMAAILFAPPARGQNANSGELRGLVTDSSGAVVADVAVTITNVQTGVVTITKTNGSGIYDAPSVPLGDYTVTFSKSGFRDLVHKGITVQVGTTTIDATLQLGEATARIEVTAEAPLLQTETSDQQVNFDTKQVLDSPIVGGIWFSELTKVLPGVGGGGGRDASGGEGVAVNGTQSYTANFQIEGTSATDPRDQNASDNFVPIDAIGEINVNTANAGAQNGNSLLSLNVNLKGGTNHLHGSLFEFVQNDIFNARSFFNSGTKAPERWNEFGGSVGGAIIKNKLFFYFTYQRNPVGGGGFFQATVPTDAMRKGDFSGANFTATIYDKNSCSSNCTRTPLNGGSNILLSTQIDPVAAAILKYIPVATDKTTSFNNFSAIVGTPSLGQWYVGKIDYNISQNHRLSGSIFEYPITLIFNPDALCGLGFDCTKSTPNNRNQSARITETWIVSPTLVNEVRVGALREHDQYAPPTFGKGFPTKIGMEPAYGTNAPADVFPNITISAAPTSGIGTGNFIGGGVHANLVEDIYTGSDVLTLVRGRHTVKLGGELDRQFQHDTTWGDSSSGDFTFTGVGTKSGTSLDPRAGGATSLGIPFADFLLGDVGTWNIFNGIPTNIASWITGAFVNDDFKVASHLTLNLGLRYQHQTGWAVAGNAFGNFDPTLPNPGSFPPGALGAVRFGGVNGHNTIEPSVNSWSPRLGFAWSPWQKWSFRGSYGIFQVARGTELYAHDNFPATLGLGLTPHGFIGDGTNVAFQLQTGPPPGSVTFPTPATLSPAQFNFDRVAYYAPQLPLQYVQQFLLSIQRELPLSHLLDVSYVHTKGTHLNFATDMNQVPEADLANQFNTGDFSPFRSFKQFRSILSHDFDGWSNYDALQLRLIKRLTHGVSYQFNYAWSKTMDTGTSSGHDQGLDGWQRAKDPRANYALSQLDGTNNFNGSISYDLPFGEGRTYPVHGVLNQVVGGWRITSVVQARSGVPFTPVVGGNANGGDPALSGSPNCFCSYWLLPNRTGSGKVSNPTIDHWADVTAFADPTNSGTTPAFGNSGRNILRGPGFVNFDLSLGKSFHIREGMNLEFRADSYNAFNTPHFGTPDNNILATYVKNGVTLPHFGVISSVVGGGRIFQMGGRFTF
jgi:hypothetical protein